MSLRWRLALGLGVITVAVVSIVGTGAYLAVADRLEGNVDDALEARAAEVTRAGGAGDEHRPGHQDEDDEPAFTRPPACPPAGAVQPAAGAQLVAADGTTTPCIEGGVALPVDARDRAIADDPPSGSYLRTVEIDGARYRIVTVAQLDGTALQIARGLDETDDALESMRRWLVGIGVAGVAGAVLMGWLLARRTVRPVERLRSTTEHIAATQDLAAAVPIGGPSEIASLGRSFVTMVDALAASRRDQQRLVSDASHELRTPLTSLRTNAELLGRAGELTDAQRRSVVEGIAAEVDELTHLVSELVDLASDEARDNEPVEAVDLAGLSEDVAARARRRTGRSITVTVGRPETVEARPQAMTRAIWNLVDNACKYSDGPVEIVVDGGRLEVRDRGPGIAEDDRAHVFDRFYRAAGARTEPGSGLGLAIVAREVERHGGVVWAGDRADPDPAGHLGAAVGFELPAPRAQA